MKKFFLTLFCFLLFANIGYAAGESTVVIQPGPEDGKDTYFGTNSVGGRNGRPDDFEIRIGGWGDYWTSYLQFELTAIPAGAILESAYLHLFNNRVDTNDNYGKLYRVAEYWDESDPEETSFPESLDYGMSYQFVPNNDWWVVDVSEIVTDWKAGTYDNYGFKALGQYNNNFHGKGFYSSDYLDDPTLRPKLVVTYTLPEEEGGGIEELADELEMLLEDTYSDMRSRRIVYTALLNRAVNSAESGNIEAAERLMGRLLKSVQKDETKGRIDGALADKIIMLADSLLEEIQSMNIPNEIPLITQTASPYPPESANWAGLLYADGRANYSGSCGATIEQCGCALSSFAMLGQSHGLTTGVDGSDATPPNIDAWLLANNGYTSKGDINWSQAIKYFSKPGLDGSSYFTIDTLKETDRTVIDAYLENNRPVITETLATSRSGSKYTHFVLSTDLYLDTYSIKDPLWYNTENLDDIRDRIAWVQDYDDIVTSGRLFEFHEKPKKVVSGIEIHLASPAEMVLTDKNGDRIGFDPESGLTYSEVEGEYYEESAVYSEEMAESGVAPHVTKILYVPNPVSDNYSLEIIGTDVGDYSVSILITNDDGSSEYIEIEEETSLNDRESYEIELDLKRKHQSYFTKVWGKGGYGHGKDRGRSKKGKRNR